MVSFLLALQFLTIMPIKINRINEKKISQSMIYFPLIGLLLGLILAGANRFLSILNFEQFVSNIILIVLLIIFTGGLHLDGLADTADAFLSRKNKEEMLKIMRDYHIGVMGVLSLISIILLKISFLVSINMPLKTIALVLMCVLSRWSQVFAMFLFPYARDEGKAKVFMQGINLNIFSLATIITLFFVVLLWQLKGLLIFAITAMCAYITGKYITRKLNGITGDILGAMNELIELNTLLVICLLERTHLWIT